MEHLTLSQVDRLKGKFRLFLLACFQNYPSVETQRAHALKRGGSVSLFFVDLETGKSRYRLARLSLLELFRARQGS